MMNYHDSDKAKQANTPDTAMREMTIGELIDRRIEKAERQARDLRSLKEGMSIAFLQSGASKISSLLEV